MRTTAMSTFILSRSLTSSTWRSTGGQIQQFLFLAVLPIALMLTSSLASAGGLQVSPVTLALSQAERAGIITVSNNSQTPMNAQARVFKWTQTSQDEYVLEPTTDLIVTPPIMQLAPGVLQELRLIRTQAPGDLEQPYRLIIDQLPNPSAKPQKGISILIRHNIPVFLNSTDRPTVDLQWRAQAISKDKTRISISNPSKNRAQIARVWLQTGEETTDLRGGLTGYALPGSTIVREFDVPLSKMQAPGTELKAQINGSETTIVLGN